MSKTAHVGSKLKDSQNRTTFLPSCSDDPRDPIGSTNSLLESLINELWRNRSFGSRQKYLRIAFIWVPKMYPNWIIEVFIVCAGVEKRRCFWRDPKLRLRHSSIIKLSNKLFGDPIGSSGPSEQLGKKSRPILRVFQFWTNVRPTG